MKFKNSTNIDEMMTLVGITEKIGNGNSVGIFARFRNIHDTVQQANERGDDIDFKKLAELQGRDDVVGLGLEAKVSCTPNELKVILHHLFDEAGGVYETVRMAVDTYDNGPEHTKPHANKSIAPGVTVDDVSQFFKMLTAIAKESDDHYSFIYNIFNAIDKPVSDAGITAFIEMQHQMLMYMTAVTKFSDTK